MDIRGFATDPLIVVGDLTQPTSDNFGRYSVALRKQGAAGEVLVTTSTSPLRASDTSIVSESTHHTVPGGFYSFPVKIINDLPRKASAPGAGATVYNSRIRSL